MYLLGKAEQNLQIIQSLLHYRSSGLQRTYKIFQGNFVWRICITVWRIPTENFLWSMSNRNVERKVLQEKSLCKQKRIFYKNWLNWCQKIVVCFGNLIALRLATSLKRRLWHRCFLVNFAEFSRTPSLQNTSGWLLIEFKNTYHWISWEVVKVKTWLNDRLLH